MTFDLSTPRESPPHSVSYRRDTTPLNPTHAYEILHKWNLKFSCAGQKDPETFLMLIEEDRMLVPIQDRDLVRALPFFFSGIALNWFRGSRHRWATYNDFAAACRIRFGDMDFQFEMRQEIHRRTQGERKRVADYLTCMRSLFDRVIPGLSESEEVSYAHRNLLPRLRE